MVDGSKRQSGAAVERAESGYEVVVGGRFRLLSGAPLPELDLGDAKAFVARDDRSPNEDLFARICPPGTMPRLGIVNNVRHMMEASLMRPLEYGTIRWPGMAGYSTAIVFKRPLHGALMAPGATTISRMQPDEISRCVLAPAVLTLGYMAQRSLTHRAIRPDNMYWNGTLKTSVLLGDCVSSSPALLQPAIYEPVESAMTPPVGRGPGTIADDFYALGVTALVLSSGSVPFAGASPKDIIAAKLHRGSFSALMEGERPPFGLRELLRGLLSDDSYNRWGLEQLEQWLGGGLRSSVQEVRPGAVPRSFGFDGKEFLNYRLLADAFGKDMKKAEKALSEPAFEKWLRRGVNDHALADRIRLAIDTTEESKDAAESGPLRVTKTCMLLDPYGPIRTKEAVAMPTGIGASLADAYYRRESGVIDCIRDCLSNGIAIDWYRLKGDTETVIYDQEIKLFTQIQQILANSGLGYGIERCLYMLDPFHPCRSRVLEGAYVADAQNLLPSLEAIVEKHGEIETLVDRHLVAYIAARTKINIDKPLAALEAANGDDVAIKLAMLAIFARIQSKFGPEKLPFLTAWMARELEPTINRISSKSLRDQMRKRVRSLAGTGSLVKLQGCINNDKAIRQDESARKIATRQFAAATREISQLESREFQENAQRLGWKIASRISATVSFVSVCFVTLN